MPLLSLNEIGRKSQTTTILGKQTFIDLQFSENV